MNGIERYNLVDEAYKRIKAEILSARFIEGSKIPSENQLCKELNVSRVVVREALSRLRNEKIIVTFQGKGSFKANPNNFVGITLGKELTFEDFKQVMDFRAGIEYAAVRLAVKVASNQELENIKACAKDMSAAVGEEDFNAADYRFHYMIVKSSHNGLLLAALENCSELINGALKLMNSVKDAKEYAVNLHDKIADKLIKRDAKGAIELFENNGEYNIARMQEILKN